MSFLLLGLTVIAVSWCLITVLLPLFGCILMLKDKGKLRPISDETTHAIIQAHRGAVDE